MRWRCESGSCRSFPSSSGAAGDKLPTFKIIKRVRELVAALLSVVISMKEDWVIVVPESAVVIASQFGINQAAYDFSDAEAEFASYYVTSHILSLRLYEKC
ncbi:MAG TPA: hypothetical protein VF393_06510 [archaeon]